MTKLFRLKRQKKKRRGSSTGQERVLWPRKHGEQMKLPSLYEKIAESMWRVMGWLCDEKVNASDFQSEKKCTSGRVRDDDNPYTQRIMKEDPKNRTRLEHKWGGTIVKMCGTRWPHVGRVKKTGWLRQRSKIRRKTNTIPVKMITVTKYYIHSKITEPHQITNITDFD